MAVNNSLQKSQKRLGIGSYLTGDAVKQRINQVIGGKDGQRFISAVVSAVQTNPGLQECTNQSILSAALLGESLKLSPSPQLGQYYMVPFNDRERGKVAQFQLGYKGYIQLAIRSGQYKKLNVLAIKDGELIKFDPLNEEIEVRLIEDEEAREAAETIGYYAMFEYTNGFRKAIYWSKKKMLAHADKYSQAFSANGGTVKTRYGEKTKVSYSDYVAGNFDPKDAWMYSSFWYKDFDGMAYKTMLRQLISKWGIMSIDMASAIDADMAVINDDGTKDYVDNDPDVIDMEPVSEPVQEAPAEDIQSALFGGDGQ
nr:MAG TPA: RecT protein [Caudoviricetes sp.]DAV88151.1 MAG TPA: RecT protein [Caudoviricetes sp.]